MSRISSISLDDIKESGGRLTVTSIWQPTEEFGTITHSKVKRIGYWTFVAIPVLCSILFVAPIVLLSIITSQLKEEFVMTNKNKATWEAIPGNRSVNHLKYLTFYSITDDQRYYTLKGLNLNITQTLMFRKSVKFDRLKLEDWYAYGLLTEEYELDSFQNKDLTYDQNVKQIRPGFLRAVDLIEAKTKA